MSATAGWYRDPTGTHSIRYWDGQQWTNQANSGGSNVVDPVTDQVRYVQPAPGTEVQPSAPTPPQTLQVTQQAPRSSAGTVVAVVLSVVAVLLVLVVLLTQNGDDGTDTTEPVTTEAPATTAPPSDG